MGRDGQCSATLPVTTEITRLEPAARDPEPQRRWSHGLDDASRAPQNPRFRSSMILSFAFAPRARHRFEAAPPLRQPDRLKTNALSHR